MLKNVTDPLKIRSLGWAKRYRDANKEKIREYMRGYRIRNKERLLAQARAYKKRYYGANPELKAVADRKYRKKYKDELLAKRKTKLRTNINFRLACNLRNRFKTALRSGYKNGSAVKDLGCSIEEFRLYIASKFTTGMSWDNYGEWHLDHIKPLSSFDLTQRTEILKACHYTNIQPLWRFDNLSKGWRYNEAHTS